MVGSARIRRGAVVSAVTALCLAGGASAAAAATLHASETPSVVHPGGTYHVGVSGSFKSALNGKAFLLAVIQYSSSPCARTAKGEIKRTGLTFFLHGTLSRSPFNIKATFTAHRIAPRRVCAYLYSHTVTPTQTATPIARAGAKFKVVP